MLRDQDWDYVLHAPNHALPRLRAIVFLALPLWSLSLPLLTFGVFNSFLTSSNVLVRVLQVVAMLHSVCSFLRYNSCRQRARDLLCWGYALPVLSAATYVALLLALQAELGAAETELEVALTPANVNTLWIGTVIYVAVAVALSWLFWTRVCCMLRLDIHAGHNSFLMQYAHRGAHEGRTALWERLAFQLLLFLALVGSVVLVGVTWKPLSVPLYLASVVRWMRGMAVVHMVVVMLFASGVFLPVTRSLWRCVLSVFFTKLTHDLCIPPFVALHPLAVVVALMYSLRESDGTISPALQALYDAVAVYAGVAVVLQYALHRLWLRLHAAMTPPASELRYSSVDVAFHATACATLFVAASLLTEPHVLQAVNSISLPGEIVVMQCFALVPLLWLLIPHAQAIMALLFYTVTWFMMWSHYVAASPSNPATVPWSRELFRRLSAAWVMQWSSTFWVLWHGYSWLWNPRVVTWVFVSLSYTVCVLLDGYLLAVAYQPGVMSGFPLFALCMAALAFARDIFQMTQGFDEVRLTVWWGVGCVPPFFGLLLCGVALHDVRYAAAAARLAIHLIAAFLSVQRLAPLATQRMEDKLELTLIPLQSYRRGSLWWTLGGAVFGMQGFPPLHPPAVSRPNGLFPERYRAHLPGVATACALVWVWLTELRALPAWGAPMALLLALACSLATLWGAGWVQPRRLQLYLTAEAVCFVTAYGLALNELRNPSNDSVAGPLAENRVTVLFTVWLALWLCRFFYLVWQPIVQLQNGGPAQSPRGNGHTANGGRYERRVAALPERLDLGSFRQEYLRVQTTSAGEEHEALFDTSTGVLRGQPVAVKQIRDARYLASGSAGSAGALSPPASPVSSSRRTKAPPELSATTLAWARGVLAAERATHAQFHTAWLAHAHAQAQAQARHPATPRANDHENDDSRSRMPSPPPSPPVRHSSRSGAYETVATAEPAAALSVRVPTAPTEPPPVPTPSPSDALCPVARLLSQVELEAKYPTAEAHALPPPPLQALVCEHIQGGVPLHDLLSVCGITGPTSAETLGRPFLQVAQRLRYAVHVVQVFQLWHAAEASLQRSGLAAFDSLFLLVPEEASSSSPSSASASSAMDDTRCIVREWSLSNFVMVETGQEQEPDRILMADPGTLTLANPRHLPSAVVSSSSSPSLTLIHAFDIYRFGCLLPTFFLYPFRGPWEPSKEAFPAFAPQNLCAAIRELAEQCTSPEAVGDERMSFSVLLERLGELLSRLGPDGDAENWRRGQEMEEKLRMLSERGGYQPLGLHLAEQSQ